MMYRVPECNGDTTVYYINSRDSSNDVCLTTMFHNSKVKL